MTYVAQPYEPFVDDLLTGLTGGVTREEHRFTGVKQSYVLTSPGVIPASVKVFGQREELFKIFVRGVDYQYDPETEAIVWNERGVVPDDHSYFYVNYDRQEAVRLLTDRNPGSVTSIFAETFARELAILTKQMEFIYRSAFVDSAPGTSLDYVAALLALERKGANFSSGEVLFKRSSPAPADIAIPSGTATSTNEGLVFETVDKRTMRRGQLSVSAPIRAQAEGQAGLVPAGAIQIINRPIYGIDAVVNERNTLLATEKESDEAFRRRIKATLERAGRSTLGAIRTALIEEVPGVNEGNVQISEDLTAPGKVQVKFALGGAVDQSLVRRIEETIFHSRPAGIRVSHNLPTASPTDGTQGIGPDGLPIRRQDVLARMARLGGAITTLAVPENVLSLMPEGVLNLQVEVLLRLVEPNLSVGEKEQIASDARARVVDHVTALPMGSDVIYHKLLGRVVDSEKIADAMMLVRAVVPDIAASTDAYKTNLSSSGRKPIVMPNAVFVELMGEKVFVDVIVTVEAKPQAASIAGKVTDVQGRPAAGVRVIARLVGGQPAPTSTTDTLGLYTIAGLASGNYDVSVQVQGGESSRSQRVDVKSEQISILNVTMAAIPTFQANIPDNGKVSGGGRVPPEVETSVRTGLGDLFARTDSDLKKDEARTTIRQLLESAGGLLQLVEAQPVVVNAFYEESGRLLNNADTVPIETHQVLELRNVKISFKGALDG